MVNISNGTDATTNPVLVPIARADPGTVPLRGILMGEHNVPVPNGEDTGAIQTRRYLSRTVEFDDKLSQKVRVICAHA